MKEQRPLFAFLMALLIIVPGVVLAIFQDEIFGMDDDSAAAAPEAAELLVYETSSTELSGNVYQFEDFVSPESRLLIATMTPVLIRYHILEGGIKGDPFANQLVLGDSDKALHYLSLADRELVAVETPESAEDASAALALEAWESSELVIAVSSYEGALLAGPLASYLTVPIVYLEGSASAITKAALEDLGCSRVLLVGDTPAVPGFKSYRVHLEELNELYLETLAEKGDSSSYLVVTNPNDVNDYERTEDYLPVTDLSLLSSQLAAYRKAPILFGEGLEEYGTEFGDGFTQLGVSREVNNAVADIILGTVQEGVALLEEHGMDAVYLALVGGPITLPMYSWDINDHQAERQYTPCDYYFGNLNEDPYQELAVGRIFARSPTDASLMVQRTLDFEAVKDYSYPKDESSTIYESISEDWKENSMAMVGTTKIGPGPGILTPTLGNQTKTMTEGGYYTTSMGYDIATQAELVKEIVDEMNYAVYYGHGDYDCWYSTVPDPVDADMLNSQELKPGFAIAMACLTGMTDTLDIPLDQLISLAFIHSGYTGYIGATRVAYGLYDYEVREDGVMRGTGALYLVDRFSEHICHEDMDVGEALRLAKNGLITTQGWDRDTADGEESQITVTQYVLYGDPAGNLFVPALN